MSRLGERFDLDRAGCAWRIVEGEVSIFARAPSERLHPLATLTEGEVFFGLEAETGQEQAGGFVAVALGPARIEPVSPEAVDEAEKTRWLLHLRQSLPESGAVSSAFLAPGDELELPAGGAALLSASGWLEVLEGSVSLPGGAAANAGASGLLPEGATLEAVRPARVRLHARIADAPDAPAESRSGSLVLWHRATRRYWRETLARGDSQQSARLLEASTIEHTRLATALANLAGTIENHPIQPTAIEMTPLSEALVLAADLLGMKLDAAALRRRHLLGRPVEELAAAVGLRLRAVRLEADWWQRSGSPLLAYEGPERRPVVLQPRADGYLRIDPLIRKRQRVTAELASGIDLLAHQPLAPVPDGANAASLFWQAASGSGFEVAALLGLGLMAALLGFALPLGTALAIDRLVPRGEVAGLWQLAVALACAATVAAGFTLARGMVLLRIQARVGIALQPGLWDRVLRLPAALFRRFSAGDLALRAMAVETIQQAMGQAAVDAIIGAGFGLSSLWLLFYYDLRLGLAALALGALLAVAGALMLRRRLFWQRQSVQVQGQLAGLVFQLISGVAKLRVAAAERRAFAVWTERFGHARRLSLADQRILANLLVMNGVGPTLALLVLYVIVGGAPHSIAPGAFMASTTALAEFIGAGFLLLLTVGSVLRAIPLAERAAPLLAQATEVRSGVHTEITLAGRIELSHVNFGYLAERPPVLKNFSLRVEAGEFVAIVGPSGGGKSSILRLLLGFEKPDAGAVYYDGYDLSTLDIGHVRRQLGVVLQSARVQPGTIFEAIAGRQGYSMEQAWEAARVAGLAEQIEQLPMGMHTFVNQAGSSFSGGQMQLLSLARALIGQPRMVLLDEATSALDNRTQARVVDTLERIRATRIVVAHRLSTVMRADRCCVVVNGEIVQEGRYAELAACAGPFAELARRQLA